MSSNGETSDLPAFVQWPSFPFEGDLRVKAYGPVDETEPPRAGESGGPVCLTCQASDDAFIWVDNHWRVSAAERCALPVQVVLTTREHLDQDELDDTLAGELGRMIVRLDRAIQVVPGIARVHVARRGDGASHFHMGFFGRAFGARKMLGWCLPMWSMILAPTVEDNWKANLAIVAKALGQGGGEVVLGTS
ncbi:MAG: hypothetical protein J2P57_04625 [Acidimicrobiaceae bacterium]|nr:hypothetical protein [Acidimicrobiaceae bacterium]